VNDPRTAERTFAFVDLAGFTALTEAHGDAEALDAIRAFRERALACLADDAHLVKTIGDALLLAFPEPETAVEALCRSSRESSNPPTPSSHGWRHTRHGHRRGRTTWGQPSTLLLGWLGRTRRQIVATTDVAVAARASPVVSSVGPTCLRNITGRSTCGRSTSPPPTCPLPRPSARCGSLTEGPAVVSLTWDDSALVLRPHLASRFAPRRTSWTGSDAVVRDRRPGRGGVDLRTMSVGGDGHRAGVPAPPVPVSCLSRQRLHTTDERSACDYPHRLGAAGDHPLVMRADPRHRS
jgi:hypothetical protein